MYTDLAAVYDRLMGDIPYDRFAALFAECVRQTGSPALRVVDLGCGTGAMFSSLMQTSRMIYGIDPSSEMLAQAAQKAAIFGQRIVLMQSSAMTLRIPAKVPWCVSFCDVINYILSYDELLASFRAVAASLSQSGWFLFDVHSLAKAKSRIGDNVYFDVGEDAVSIMRTHIDANSMLSYDVVLFTHTQGDMYRRSEERHLQKVHSEQDICRALEEAGFTRVHVGADFHFAWSEEVLGGVSGALQVVSRVSDQLLNDADRWFFLAQI